MSEDSGEYHESYRQPWPKSSRKTIKQEPKLVVRQNGWQTVNAIPIDSKTKLSRQQQSYQIDELLSNDSSFQTLLEEFTSPVYGVVQLFENRIVVDVVVESAPCASTNNDDFQCGDYVFVVIDPLQRKITSLQNTAIYKQLLKSPSARHYNRELSSKDYHTSAIKALLRDQ